MKTGKKGAWRKAYTKEGQINAYTTWEGVMPLVREVRL